MQRTLVIVDYGFDRDNILVTCEGWSRFQTSSVIMMRYCGYSSTQNNKKISLNIFQLNAQHKSLVIFANIGLIISARKSGYDHQRKLIGTNKNMCFGCIVFSSMYYDDSTDIIDHIPDDISKFIVVYMRRELPSDIKFDLREMIHLQELYHCFVDINTFNIYTTYEINNSSDTHIIYDSFDFKLPYGCVTEIIDDFDKLISL